MNAIYTCSLSWRFGYTRSFRNLNSSQGSGSIIAVYLFRRRTSCFTLIDHCTWLIGPILWDWGELCGRCHKVCCIVCTRRNRIQMLVFRGGFSSLTWSRPNCSAILSVNISDCRYARPRVGPASTYSPRHSSTKTPILIVPASTLASLMTASNGNIREIALHYRCIGRLSHWSVLLGATCIENASLVGCRGIWWRLVVLKRLLARKLEVTKRWFYKFLFDLLFKIDQF